MRRTEGAPLQLGMGEREGMLQKGDIVLAWTGGAGITTAAIALKWTGTASVSGKS